METIVNPKLKHLIEFYDEMNNSYYFTVRDFAAPHKKVECGEITVYYEKEREYAEEPLKIYCRIILELNHDVILPYKKKHSITNICDRKENNLIGIFDFVNRYQHTVPSAIDNVERVYCLVNYLYEEIEIELDLDKSGKSNYQAVLNRLGFLGSDYGVD